MLRIYCFVDTTWRDNLPVHSLVMYDGILTFDSHRVVALVAVNSKHTASH